MSVAVPEPEPQPASANVDANARVTNVTRVTARRALVFMGMKYGLAGSACHNSTVRPRRVRTTVVLALALAPAACRQTAVYCPAPPPLVCPDGGAPSFAADVYPNVIEPVCGNCHEPGGQEPTMPFLTTYQQIYGQNGSEAHEIYTQVSLTASCRPATRPRR